MGFLQACTNEKLNVSRLIRKLNPGQLYKYLRTPVIIFAIRGFISITLL